MPATPSITFLVAFPILLPINKVSPSLVVSLLRRGAFALNRLFLERVTGAFRLDEDALVALVALVFFASRSVGSRVYRVRFVEPKGLLGPDSLLTLPDSATSSASRADSSTSSSSYSSLLLLYPYASFFLLATLVPLPI